LTVPCTWTAPCNAAGCSRCERRKRFQLAKAEPVSAGRKAVPLSVLRAMDPPPIKPEELADAGAFLITHGYLRASLDMHQVGGQQVVLQVEPLRGELAGVPFGLHLPALDFRVQIVDLLRRTGGPVGPCVLQRRYLEPTAGVWSICSLEPGGELWDPFGTIEDDPPAPGSDPVPFY
jgi:hypothetical protein